MIDTHAHLNFPGPEKDLDRIIKTALLANVTKIICVSSNLADSERAVNLVKKYPGIVYAAVGIHPHNTNPQLKIALKVQINSLAQMIKNENVVAIGECGLDYSPAPPDEKDRSREEQLFLFKEQLKLAIANNLPVIIHSRKAFPDTLSVLDEIGQRKKMLGVWHCYSAGKKKVAQIQKLGLFFGVDGNITYDVGLQEVFTQIPLEQILLETDTPFLTPLPHRGELNQPAYTRFVAKKLSQIKSASIAEVDRITSSSAATLFKI